MADAHAAAGGRGDAGLLGHHEQRHVAGSVHLHVGVLEHHAAAGPRHARGEVGLEPLDGEVCGRLAPPQGLGVVEEPGRPARVAGALAPVGAEALELCGGGEVEAARLGGVVVHHAQARELVGQLGQLLAEQGVLGGAGGVDEHDVGIPTRGHERANHGHHRGQARAGGEHEQRARLVRQGEVALGDVEEEDVAGLRVAHERAGDEADVGHRDLRVRARGRGERVGAPLPHPVHVDADACPLAGVVGPPARSGAERDGGGAGRRAGDGGDHPAQLAGGVHGVEQAEDVLRRERVQERRDQAGEQEGAGHAPTLWRSAP